MQNIGLIFGLACLILAVVIPVPVESLPPLDALLSTVNNLVASVANVGTTLAGGVAGKNDLNGNGLQAHNDAYHIAAGIKNPYLNLFNPGNYPNYPYGGPGNWFQGNGGLGNWFQGYGGPGDWYQGFGGNSGLDFLNYIASMYSTMGYPPGSFYGV